MDEANIETSGFIWQVDTVDVKLKCRFMIYGSDCWTLDNKLE